MKTIKLLAALFLVLFVQTLNAQTPEHYPPVEPEPIEFTLLNTVLYIVLPLLLIAGYLLYRRSQKKTNKEDTKNSNEKK